MVKLYIDGDLDHVPGVLLGEAGGAQRLEVLAGVLDGPQRELLGERADRPLAIAEPVRAAPVERDPVGHHRVAPCLAQRGAVRDQAVQAAVGHRDDDRDHLALRRAQPGRLLVQQAEVGEPRRQPLGPEGVGAEHVRHEADPLARGAEEPL